MTKYFVIDWSVSPLETRNYDHIVHLELPTFEFERIEINGRINRRINTMNRPIVKYEFTLIWGILV